MTPGIGRAIGSTRAETTNTHKLSALGAALHAWFFPGGDPITTTLESVCALAKVGNGWFGALIFGTDSTATTYYVPDTSSVVEVLSRACRQAQRALGFAFRWSLSSTGVATIEADEAFTLVTSSTAGSRLGLASIYTGSTSYTGSAPAYQTTIPSLGLALSGAETLARGSGEPMADSGAYSALPGLTLQGGSGTLTIYGDHEELAEWDLEGTFDVCLIGRWAERVRIRGQSRNAWGIQPESAYLEHEVVGVRL